MPFGATKVIIVCCRIMNVLISGSSARLHLVKFQEPTKRFIRHENGHNGMFKTKASRVASNFTVVPEDLILESFPNQPHIVRLSVCSRRFQTHSASNIGAEVTENGDFGSLPLGVRVRGIRTATRNIGVGSKFVGGSTIIDMHENDHPVSTQRTSSGKGVVMMTVWILLDRELNTAPSGWKPVFHVASLSQSQEGIR